MEYGKNNELKVLSKEKWFWELEGGVKLPFDQCGDETINIGEKINVFVYMDIEKGLMGTLNTVFGQVGELAYLHVVNVSEMGAFLDLGIGKDVLLLKNKMEAELKVGDEADMAADIEKAYHQVKNGDAPLTELDKELCKIQNRTVKNKV